jgi:AraC family transcriptional regulator
MALEIPLKPVERIVFRNDTVAVAQFVCPGKHPLFRDSGPCSNHTFVFPRTVTVIARADGARFVGSPNVVAFYNQHEMYRREPVSEVDASDWYVVADDVLADTIAAFDPAVRDRPERPFRFPFGPVETSVYLRQRRLLNRLAAGGLPEPLLVEETVLGILGRLLARAYGASSRALSTRERDAVVGAQRTIGRDPARNPKLRDLAAAGGLSAFQLCRAFAKLNGCTMTEYRNALRVRLALDRLADPRTDLSTLALDLGFSSHSHFTLVFRRHVGIPPSIYRASA